jgi:DNA transposition AAA+ family ATPase
VTSRGSATEFIETRQYHRFREFCDACAKYQYIGLCYGPPGVGKTLSARNYSEWDKLSAFLNRREHNGMKLPEVQHCSALFFTASAAIANAPIKLERAIENLRDSLIHLRRLKIQEEEEAELFAAHDHMTRMRTTPPNPGRWYEERRELAWKAKDAFTVARERYVRRCRDIADPVTLIIVDEVDLLKMSGLEQLRAIFDRGNTGLVLIGMPGLEKRLARYPQLYSRVGFVHEFRPLSSADVRQLLLDGWVPSGLTLPQGGFIDEEALAALIRVSDGRFRLLHRMLTQISRLLEINQMEQITVPLVEAARESLVIGTT